MIRTAVLVALLTTPALAQPLDGAGFGAYVNGKTLSFALPDGTTFGRELYGKDRSVLWSTAPGLCQDGVWFDRDGMICFVYTNDPDPKCWTITRTDRGLRAESTGGTVLYESERAPDPLSCPGPDLLSETGLVS